MNTVKKSGEKPRWLGCERLWVFAVLTVAGGFLGAYTYTLKGGVFCNAQTANFVLLAMRVGTADFRGALYFLIPISAYAAGTVISEIMPAPIKRLSFFRWDTVLVAFEIAVVAVLAFLPDSVPVQVFQVSVNFIAAMQFNTFRQAESMPMATTFCTNHLRQTCSFCVKWVRHRERAARRRFLSHLLMLASFVAGGIISSFLCTHLGGRALIFAAVPLGTVLIYLAYSDLVTEKDRLTEVPHGH